MRTTPDFSAIVLMMKQITKRPIFLFLAAVVVVSLFTSVLASDLLKLLDHSIQEADKHPLSHWTPLRQLPTPPPNMQASYWPEGSDTLHFSYDGSVAADKLVSPDDPHYPSADEVKLTAHIRSRLHVSPPQHANRHILMVSKTGLFLKDGRNVYFLACEGLGCGYNVVVKADPETFVELTKDNNTGVVYATDAGAAYQCKLGKCVNIFEGNYDN